MAAKNDITGDTIATRQITDSYRDNFDRIFRNKDKKNDNTEPTTVQNVSTTTDTNEYTQTSN